MRRNIKLAKSQQGVALIAAISIATIMLLVSYTLFNISYSNSVLSKNQIEKIHKMSSMQEAFTNSIANSSFDYSQNLILPEITEYRDIENGEYLYETTNSDLNEASLQVKPFILAGDGYTTRALDYYIKLTINNYEKNINIRVISNKYISQDNVIDRSSISLNIPAVDYHALTQIQLNSNDTLTNTDVGYIGDLSINNDNELIFTNTDGSKHYLNLPSNFTGIFNLSQGWLLNNGIWEVSIGVYNINSSQGCIIKASLDDFIADISALECVPIEEDTDINYEDARYPNPLNFPMCITREIYNKGDICHEDGILFIAHINNAQGLPFENASNWRVYYPSPDWVAPYTQGAYYSVGDLVVYDSILFENTQDGENQDPGNSNSGWQVNGIYGFSNNVDKYAKGEVVIYDGEFFQKTSNSKNKSPNNTRHWENLGSTLTQDEIDQLPTELQGQVIAGMSATDIKPYSIIFPYRDEITSPYSNNILAQEYLNCNGAYPSIDTSIYKQCINGNQYDTGDICYENNQLFIAQYWTTRSPFKDSSWRLYTPLNLDWVVPYSSNITYGDTSIKVIFDGKRFVNKWWASKGFDPYNSNVWKVDDIYEWHNSITYMTDDIVIRNGTFYSAKWENKFEDPLYSGKWGAWSSLGNTYNGQTAQEILSYCDTWPKT